MPPSKRNDDRPKRSYEKSIKEFASVAWMKDAACRNLPWTDFFLPSDDMPLREEHMAEKRLPGIQVCRTCPVQETCLEYALYNNDMYGIWGGKTSLQRRYLRRKYHPKPEASIE